MRRTILVLPHALAAENGESFLLDLENALEPVVSRSRLSRLIPLEDSAVPEAAWLGLDPSKVPIADGPLMLAALGADPPERGVQFHLSLMSCVDGVALDGQYVPPSEDLRLLLSEAEKLNTAALTMVNGPELDHGLVWEKGSLDLRTHSSRDAADRPLASVLPEGDGERILRRYIDDSVNLLSTLEINERRIDEGIPPLNLLWPWGQGLRLPMPNLAIQRGVPALVESGSMRLKGLARMVRYRHGDVAHFSTATKVDLGRLLKLALQEDVLIILIESFGPLRRSERFEETSRWMKTIVEQLILKLTEPKEDLQDLYVLLPTHGPHQPDGLALHWQSQSKEHNGIPFDERAVEERRLQRRNVWTEVEEALRG